MRINSLWDKGLGTWDMIHALDLDPAIATR